MKKETKSIETSETKRKFMFGGGLTLIPESEIEHEQQETLFNKSMDSNRTIALDNLPEHPRNKNSIVIEDFTCDSICL